MSLVDFTNPFDLAGPDFLLLYLVVMAVGFVLAVALRAWLRSPHDALPAGLVRPNAYEIAYLSGGARLTLDTAIAMLVARGVLTVDVNNRRLVPAPDQTPGTDLIERGVYDAVIRYRSLSVDYLHSLPPPEVEQPASRLEAQGLILTDYKARLVRMIPALVFVMIAIFGFLKIAIGISRDRPVGFLVVLTLLAVLVAVLFYRKQSLRTRRGDKFLASLKRENAPLQTTARTHPRSLAGHDLAMAIGLYGLTTVAFSSSLIDLNTIYRPQHNTSGSSASSDASSGSSCGGGSSSSCGGGGGGCGGGGCGGCGGS